MERTKYLRLIYIVTLMVLFTWTVSGEESRKLKVYNAYVEGNMDQWGMVIREMENAPDLSDKEKRELTGYYYGYIGYLMGMNKEKQAKIYIHRGDSLVNRLMKESPDDATLLAYKGSFLGFKMGLNKFRAVTLGPESMKYIKKAYALEPDNVQVTADMANMLYYAPALFGGNKKEALTLYQQTVDRIEKRGETAGNWFYLNLLTTLAQLYETQNLTDQAIGIYQKILLVEPRFKWVRDELYPAAMSR